MTIEIKNLRCGYKGKPIIDSFSAKVSSGDILCFLGPNGVGKTTLFKSILRLLPIISGSVDLDGVDFHSFSPKEYAKIIAYVPQAHSTPFAFRVFDVVAMGRTAHLGIMSRPGGHDLEIAACNMERLEISHLADRVFTELSGGERQMVLIARALTQEPAFLMMDEPTSNLDFGNQTRVLKNVRMLASQGLGIIMTTHQPDHVFQCRATVSLMMSGNRYLSGPAEQIITEENLRKAYSIDVAVLNAQYHDNELHICQPIINDAE